MIERGNMTDEEYIAALEKEHLRLKSEIQSTRQIIHHPTKNPRAAPIRLGDNTSIQIHIVFSQPHSTASVLPEYPD